MGSWNYSVSGIFGALSLPREVIAIAIAREAKGMVVVQIGMAAEVCEAFIATLSTTGRASALFCRMSGCRVQESGRPQFDSTDQ